MKIIQVEQPRFEVNGVNHYTNPYMFGSLNDFQIEIDKMERKGATTCYFYSLYTQHEKGYDLGEIKENGVPEFIPNDKDIIIYWIRCKFLIETT